ncbi:MAG: hypothetical protein RR475_03060 [Clostridia bacterium]
MELIDRIYNGDREAQRQFISRYMAVVFEETAKAVNDYEQSKNIAKKTFKAAFDKIKSGVALSDERQVTQWLKELANSEIYGHSYHAQMDKPSYVWTDVKNTISAGDSFGERLIQEAKTWQYRDPAQDNSQPVSNRRADARNIVESINFGQNSKDAQKSKPKDVKVSRERKETKEHSAKPEISFDDKNDNRKIGIKKNISDNEKREGKFAYAVAVFVLTMLAATLFWIFVGLLMRVNIIPSIDFGYEWFNTNVFMLF